MNIKQTLLRQEEIVHVAVMGYSTQECVSFRLFRRHFLDQLSADLGIF